MTEVTVLSSGHGVAEAPLVDERGTICFSDITKGGVYGLEPDGTRRTLVPRRKGVGGLGCHRDGGLVLAGRDICHVKDGETRQILSPADFPVQPGVATSFNDFGVGADGDLFVGTIRIDAGGFRVHGELARSAAPHRADVLLGDVLGANGVVVLPDGSQVLQAQSHARRVAAVRLAGPDRGSARYFSTDAVPGVPDGLALDDQGNIWIAFYGGGCLAQWSPAGKLLARVDLPASHVTSLCFDPVTARDVIVTTADFTEEPSLGGCVLRLSLGVTGPARPQVTI